MVAFCITLLANQPLRLLCLWLLRIIIRKLYGVAQRLEQDLGRRPTPEAIAEEMDIEPRRVRWMLRISRRPLSLERPVGEKDSELGSFIEDERAPSPTEIAERSLLREDLEQMLSTSLLTHPYVGCGYFEV